ncbi:hypothetical protein V1264_003311 [Littorina saxatilis]|uniref:Uncharacterized protein n=1 Tax=Littorina saxatilis TaxID=31220 RepID=A0AAN9G933_9CAEN
MLTSAKTTTSLTRQNHKPVLSSEAATSSTLPSVDNFVSSAIKLNDDVKSSVVTPDDSPSSSMLTSAVTTTSSASIKTINTNPPSPTTSESEVPSSPDWSETSASSKPTPDATSAPSVLTSTSTLRTKTEISMSSLPVTSDETFSSSFHTSEKVSKIDTLTSDAISTPSEATSDETQTASSAYAVSNRQFNTEAMPRSTNPENTRSVTEFGVAKAATVTTFDPTATLTSVTRNLSTIRDVVASCGCQCHRAERGSAQEHNVRKKIQEIQTNLTMSKHNLSSTVRKRRSADDPRPSAQAVGLTGVLLLLLFLLFVPVADCMTWAQRRHHGKDVIRKGDGQTI